MHYEWSSWLLLYLLLVVFTTSAYLTTNLDFSKLKEFSEDNFKFDGNGRKF